MRIKIRNWDTHFEADRSKQWKSIKWVPVPNKQGLGYKKIMAQKNGAEIFGCWNAIVQQASLCNPRGDLSKYTIEDLSINTIIPINILNNAITFIIQNLDWIEVIENHDKSVNDPDKSVIEPAVGSSILFSSVLCNSIQSSEDPIKDNVSSGNFPLFEHWQSKKNLAKHRTITKDHETAEREVLKIGHSIEELKSAIDIYDKIMGEPEETYYGQYKHSFDAFFRKGVQKPAPYKKFLAETDPLNNLKKNKTESEDDLFNMNPTFRKI